MRGENDCRAVELEAMEPRSLLSSSLEVTGPLVLKSNDEVRAAISADLNADGIDDLAMSVGSQVRVRLGRSDGTLGPAYAAGQFALNAGLLAAGDFDGDGKMDLAAARVAGARGWMSPAQTWVRVLFGDGAGGFTPGPMVLMGERVRSFAPAQFDLDRRVELLFNGWVLDLRGRGAGAHIVATRAIELVTWDSAAMDLDGDGRAEIVAIVPTLVGLPGSMNVVVERNAGGTAFVLASSRLFDGATARVDSVALGDVTGDGRADVVFTLVGNDIDVILGPHTETGYLTVGVSGLALSGPTIVNQRDLGSLGGKFSQGELHQWVVGITDFNADGRPDILVATTRQGIQGTLGSERDTGLTLLLARGDGTFAAFAGPGLYLANVNGDDVGSTTPDRLPSFFLYGRSAAGGWVTGPDVITVNRASTVSSGDQWRAVRIRNTQAWKPPTASSTGIFRTHAAPGTDPIMYPPPRVFVGDQVQLYTYAYTPETSRGASIAGVRFILDSNENGTPDDQDIAIGNGLLGDGGSWRLSMVAVDGSWLTGAANGRVIVFAVATDSASVSGPPGVLTIAVATP